MTGLIAGFNSIEDFLISAAEPTLVGLIVSIFLFNIANVLFNLIPAFPMDGGRLVRAGLTTILGRETATNVAVLFGYIIAAAMLVVGNLVGATHTAVDCRFRDVSRVRRRQGRTDRNV